MVFRPATYETLPPKARAAWDAIWRAWAGGSPDTCDRDEADAILRDLAVGADPADTVLSEGTREWATDGERAAMFQSGAVLRSCHIYHWFDGDTWLVDLDSAIDGATVIEDCEIWDSILTEKVFPAMREAFPGMGWED